MRNGVRWKQIMFRGKISLEYAVSWRCIRGNGKLSSAFKWSYILKTVFCFVLFFFFFSSFFFFFSHFSIIRKANPFHLILRTTLRMMQYNRTFSTKLTHEWHHMMILCWIPTRLLWKFPCSLTFVYFVQLWSWLNYTLDFKKSLQKKREGFINYPQRRKGTL